MEQFTRRTRGSPIWSSCRPSLLESRGLPIMVENPLLDMIRQIEKETLEEMYRKRGNDVH